MLDRPALKKLKQKLWPWRAVITSVPSLTILVLLIRSLGGFQGFELRMLDYFFRWRPLEARDQRITIVGVSEQDLQKYGHPINDDILATLLETIAAEEPRAIGLDVYRDLPVPSPNDQKQLKGLLNSPDPLNSQTEQTRIAPSYKRLSDVFRNNPNIIGITKVTGGTESVAPPPVLAELGQISANDIPPDIDERYRRAYLYLKPEEDGETYFGLGFKLAMLYLDQSGIVPRMSDNNEWVQIEETIFYPIEENSGSYVNNDSGGYPILINYRGPSGSFDQVTLDEVLTGQVDRSLFHDRIVLIGSTAESLKDVFSTPFTSFSRGTDKARVPGVEIHASITSQILSATLDGRKNIRTISDFVEALIILGGASLGGILSWHWRYSSPFWRVAPHILGVVGFGGIAYGCFLAGWWIPVVPPVVAQISTAIAITAYIARSAADIRQTFSRYLTDEVVETLLETPNGLNMGGERRRITILTSDLRGFTGISERLPPEQVIGILNIYLEAMATAIVSHQGTIDEFMGDGILVLFGAPTQRDDDPERAVACAIAMQKAMIGVNQQMADRNLPLLEMGIGIHTGEVVVGNIGSIQRTKYGVVGSQVNLTYRIEAYTVGGQILITDVTKHQLTIPIETDGQQYVSPKGVIEPILIHSVTGIGGKYNLHLVNEVEELRPIDPPLELNFAEIKGKDISPDRYVGQLIGLSEKHVDLVTERSLLPLLNLQFRLTINDQDSETEFYAKVMKQGPQPNTFRLRLTSIPLDVKNYFATLYDAEQKDTSVP
jgi:adenylate cyclase